MNGFVFRGHFRGRRGNRPHHIWPGGPPHGAPPGGPHPPGRGSRLPPWIKESEYGGLYKEGKPEEDLSQSTESFELPSDSDGIDPASQKLEGFELERDPEANDIQYQERDAPLSGLPNNFTKQDFQDQRTKSTITQAIENLSKYGKDITNTPLEQLKVPLGKACMICCNYYLKPKYALGSGPINDSTTVAENHQRRGYDVYFILNPTPERFVDVVAFFLHNTKKALTLFYTGHGAQVKDKSGDEDDGYDEAMVFDSGHIVDDDLLTLLKECGPNDVPILLLSDCCHSGSIWDLQSEADKSKLPKMAISVSAAKDSQTAKQTKINSKDQGIFTYFFWKILNAKPKITPTQITSIINKGMAKFNQHYTVSVANDETLKKPFFA
jgi:hypothetical protein